MDALLEFSHTVLAFVLIISVIVFIHEFGHYLVARLCGVRIEAFAIGFGRELFGFNDKAGTRWKICIAPLGGYVKMFGDASEASTPDTASLTQMSEENRRVSFHYKPLWQKSLIVAAGPLANFLLSIAIFTFLIFTQGLDTTEPVVGKVMENSAAAEAGLRPGDRIVRINGDTVDRFRDIATRIATNLNEPVTLSIRRDGQNLTKTLTPKIVEQKDALGNAIKRPLIGIAAQTMTDENLSLGEAITASITRTYDMIALSLEFLGQIITGQRGAEQLRGPIGIADMSGQAASQDIHTIIWFMALLSVNLGFVNILPIPPLDGGHLLFYVLEGARGQPLAEQFQEWGYRIGFALIASIMAFTLYNDVRNLLL